MTDKVRLTLRFSKENVKRLKVLALKLESSPSKIILQAFEDYINKINKQKNQIT